MKTNKTNILLLLIIAIFTFSCSSDDFEVENSNLINFEGKQNEIFDLTKNSAYYCKIVYHNDMTISREEFRKNFRNDFGLFYQDIALLNNVLANLNINSFTNPAPIDFGIGRTIIFEFHHEENGFDVFAITHGGPGLIDGEEDDDEEEDDER